MTEDQREIGVAIVGAGAMARAHSAALSVLGRFYPQLALRPRLVAVADANAALASDLATRFGWSRVSSEWQDVVRADDVDLVIACLPPILNRDVILGAAAAAKAIVSEKPLSASATPYSL